MVGEVTGDEDKIRYVVRGADARKWDERKRLRKIGRMQGGST